MKEKAKLDPSLQLPLLFALPKQLFFFTEEQLVSTGAVAWPGAGLGCDDAARETVGTLCGALSDGEQFCGAQRGFSVVNLFS